MSDYFDALPEYISAKQIEQVYDLPRSSLHRYIKTCGFPVGQQIGPNARRWRKSEVQAWYDSRPAAKTFDMGGNRGVA